MEKIVEKELSYKIVGILFEVYNSLGGGYQEKYYQRAIKKALEDAGIGFTEQACVPLVFNGKSIGRYFIDFVIDGKIVLEVKVAPQFYKRDINQALAYLKSTHTQLAILASFSRSGLKMKRVLRGSSLSR